MEERGQAFDEPQPSDSFFHPLWVQQRAFDEIQKRVEVPFRVVFVRHNLGVCRHTRGAETQMTHLCFQQYRPERLPVHLHTHFYFHLLHLTLPPPHRILRVRSKCQID